MVAESQRVQAPENTTGLAAARSIASGLWMGKFGGGRSGLPQHAYTAKASLAHARAAGQLNQRDKTIHLAFQCLAAGGGCVEELAGAVPAPKPFASRKVRRNSSE
jgi:hypothetical protein